MKLSEIKSHLAELGLRPSKSLGQNFLHDQNLAGWIVAQLGLGPEDHLVEIGPGFGALTECALTHCGSATLIEKDSRLAEFVKNRFEGKKVGVIRGDAVDFDVRELFPRGEVKVMGNLPYYISSQILFKFTDEPSPVTRLVFTLQKELAQRLSAEPSSKEYGALTLIIQRRWQVKYLRSLPPDVFTPRPKVDSGVVSLALREPGELPDCDGTLFHELVKRGFSQRRKQLRKLIENALPAPWNGVAAKLGVSENTRAEELSLRQWIELTNLARPVGDSLAQNVQEEIFDVVDENDRITGAASRQEIHRRKLRHRAVHVFVFSRAGDLFLQKRSRWKDVHPLKWDSSAAGHVNSGDDYDTTAVRELAEELGVEDKVELIGKVPACERTGQEFVNIYRARHDGPFQLARSEIECGAFFPVELVQRWVRARPQDFATGFLECFERFSHNEVLAPEKSRH